MTLVLGSRAEEEMNCVTASACGLEAKQGGRSHTGPSSDTELSKQGLEFGKVKATHV